MIRKQKYTTHLLILNVAISFFGASSICCMNQQRDTCHEHSPGLHQKTKKFLGGLMKDMVAINYNLFDWDTYKTFVAIFPFYAIARISDERLQNCFYERKHHKNIHQFDDACSGIAQHGIVFPVFFAGVLSLAAHDREVLKTSRVFLTGFPFVMLVANVIKEFDPFPRACLRPWNEFFGRDKRSCGGFPSGHVAIATYAAMLYGLRFGVKYAVPLGGYALFTALCFLNCNRHYASQLVAGAGLGTVYALAANKLIETKLSTTLPENLKISTALDRRGSPELKVALTF